MAAAAVMMGVSLLMGAAQTRAQNRALTKQQQARNRQVELQRAELLRQTERESEIAQEQKSDRARELDRVIGTAIAAAADGGRTPMSLAAVAGAEGAVAGLDIRRIESNRMEGARARRAESVAMLEENRAAADLTAQRQKTNTIGFFGKAASTVGGYFANSAGSGNTATNAVSNPSRPMDFNWHGAETY